MTTLGQQLMEREASQARAVSRAQADEADKSAAQALVDTQKVEDYFKDLKARVIRAFAEGRSLPSDSFGSGHPNPELGGLLGLGGMFSTKCSDREHLHYPVWSRFETWAASEDLRPHWQSGSGSRSNDAGYPEETWHTIEFHPVARA